MALARYIRFQTQTDFTDETVGAFGANAHVIDPVSEDITSDKQFIYPRTAGVRAARQRVKGPNKFTGTIGTPFYPLHATSLLYYTMGAVTTNTGTPTTGTNTHIITKANTIPFFRMSVGRDLRQHDYVGGIVNSFTADYTMDDILTGNFDVIFRREMTNVALATSTAFPDFNSVERSFGGAEASVTIDATADDRIESLSISYENNVTDDAFSLGSQFLPAGLIGELGVTGSLDARFESIDLYDDFIAETQKAVVLTASFGTGDSTRQVEFDLPSMSLDTNNLPTEGFDRYVQAINFTAEPDSNDDPLIVRVHNQATNAAFTG